MLITVLTPDFKTGTVALHFLHLRQTNMMWLSFSFPDKHFVVFVTITDSMIIRFHQKWENEPYYYSNENFGNNEYMISFDN